MTDHYIPGDEWVDPDAGVVGPDAADIREANAVEDSPDEASSKQTIWSSRGRERVVSNFGTGAALGATGLLVFFLLRSFSTSTRIGLAVGVLVLSLFLSHRVKLAERVHPVFQDFCGSLHLAFLAFGFVFAIQGNQTLSLIRASNGAAIAAVIIGCAILGIIMGFAFGPLTWDELVYKDSPEKATYSFSGSPRRHVAFRAARRINAAVRF
jgi:hypothetical protein